MLARSCKLFLDVRFVDGSGSTGHEVHFTHASGRWLANLTKTAAYFMVRRQANHCGHIKRLVFEETLQDSGAQEFHTIHQNERVQITGHISPHGGFDPALDQLLATQNVGVLTQLDANRLPRLEALARSVELMVVAAVYYDGSSRGQAEIQRFYDKSPILRTRVHIVLVAPSAPQRPERNSWLSNW